MKILLFITALFYLHSSVFGQLLLLEPDGVFDGENYHADWVVAVKGPTIIYSGPERDMPRPKEELQRIDLSGQTLLPGLIEGHGHLLLYPYNEQSWNNQVLTESPELRAIRGGEHARTTLMHGITTFRDLGSEGAGYADVALREAISSGIIAGPDLIVAGPAIVATGAYGPKGFHPDVNVPLGAQEADGIEGVMRVVREQIGKGADFIKVYADYRWGPAGEARPTFTTAELRTMVEVAQSSGRKVVAHASTEEGMKRAIEAGVISIEHGDEGTLEIFQLMKEKGIGYCPTLGAVEAISTYFNGWEKGSGEIPERVLRKRESFRQALSSGVQIVFGGDVGVFSHGRNAWELELMVEYGMSEKDAMVSATSGNARLFGFPDRGFIKEGLRADLISVTGNPMEDITTLQSPALVMKEGEIIIRNQ